MSKNFKNHNELSFDEFVIYMASRIKAEQVEIGCFLCNYKDEYICTIYNRGCGHLAICEKMKEELDRLDNAKGEELEELLKPVYEYRMATKQKIKVTEAEIVVHGNAKKPYFEIKYKEVGKDEYNVGYSSYDLKNVFGWLESEFEEVVVKEQAVGKDDVVLTDWRGCDIHCPVRKLYPECYHSNCEDPTDNMSAEEIQEYMERCEKCTDKCPYKPWSPDAFCNRPKGDIEWDENWNL